MDRKEFSIAVHLIKKKLQGYELPKTLPPSLVADPVPGPGVTVAPMAGFGMPAMTIQHGQMSMGEYWLGHRHCTCLSHFICVVLKRVSRINVCENYIVVFH